MGLVMGQQKAFVPNGTRSAAVEVLRSTGIGKSARCSPKKHLHTLELLDVETLVAFRWSVGGLWSVRFSSVSAMLSRLDALDSAM